jgi:hypothetical protein
MVCPRPPLEAKLAGFGELKKGHKISLLDEAELLDPILDPV